MQTYVLDRQLPENHNHPSAISLRFASQQAYRNMTQSKDEALEPNRGGSRAGGGQSSRYPAQELLHDDVRMLCQEVDGVDGLFSCRYPAVKVRSKVRDETGHESEEWDER